NHILSWSRPLMHTPASAHCPLSLHDALPIWRRSAPPHVGPDVLDPDRDEARELLQGELQKPEYNQPESLLVKALNWLMDRLSDLDRKSTRLNSSHVKSSYAVFCLKKKRLIYR